MSFQMISFRPDFQKLWRLARQERLLPAGDDLGYAVHAVFAASFADLAPAPFALLSPGSPGGGPAGRLLAYSEAALTDLVGRVRDFADPAFAAPLMLEQAESKVMPVDFPVGARLGFRVRLRPVRRTGKTKLPALAPRKAGERDVYEGPVDGEASATGRAQAYQAWLAEKMTGAARLETCRLASFSMTRLLARDRSPAAKRPQYVAGPDAVLNGNLIVTDPKAFAVLLRRGVGRHRAFGFGMLLLAPPGR